MYVISDFENVLTKAAFIIPEHFIWLGGVEIYSGALKRQVSSLINPRMAKYNKYIFFHNPHALSKSVCTFSDPSRG